MKNLKWIIVFAIILAPLLSMAQQGRKGGGMGRLSPEQRAQVRTDSLKSLLDLNEDQVKKIKSIQLEKFQEMDSIRTTNQQVRQQRQTEIIEANQKHDAEIMAVLNEEQKAKFEEHRAKQISKMQERKSQIKNDGSRRGGRNTP